MGSNGKLTVTTPASFRPYLSFSTITPRVVGLVYTVSFDYKVLSGSPVVGLVSVGGGTAVLNKTLSGSGRFTYTYVSGGAGASEVIYFSASSAYSLQIDNVSCKQVLGNYAYQTTSASRPILRQNAVTGANYLEFDGSDDFLQTNTIDFSGTDDVTVIAACVPTKDSASILLESGLNSSTSGFGLYAPHLNNTFRSQDYRGSARSVNSLSGTATLGEAYVLRMELTAPEIKLAINGSVSKTASPRSGSYAIEPIYIGRRGGTSLAFNGQIYGLICVGRLTTDSEKKALEKEIAKRVGVTINV